MRNVLIITYEFPPKGGPGVQRCLKFAKFLPEQGWRPIILTISDPPAAVRDESLLAELPPEAMLFRSYSLEPTRAFLATKRLIGRRRRDGEEVEMSQPSQIEEGKRNLTGLPTWAIKGIQALFVPDEKIGWYPWAKREGRRIIDAHRPEVIMSSGPPNTAHVIAAALKRETGIPYVADFRDPWVGNFFLKPPTPLHAWFNRRLERRVVEAADKVISISETMTEGFISCYAEEDASKFITLTNGYDLDDFPGPDELGRSGRRPFVLIYTGTFYGTITPEPLFAAVRGLIDSGAIDPGEFEIEIVGPAEADTGRLIDRFELDSIVQRPGFKPRADALRDLAAADCALLVLGPEPASTLILTTKIFEYLAARKPILALVPEGDAAKLIKEAGAGLVVHPRDIESIAAALMELIAGHRRGQPLVSYHDKVVERFDRRRLTARLATVFSDVGSD